MKPPTTTTKLRKRISIADAEAVAELTENQRLNYRESCAILGLNYDTWLSWKGRAENEPRYSHIIARVKGAYLKGQIANIRAGALGEGPHRRADWRASNRLLEIAAPERYLPSQQQAAPPPPMISSHVINVMLQAAYQKSEPEPVRIVDVAEVAQLVETTEPPMPPPKVRMPPISTPDPRRL